MGRAVLLQSAAGHVLPKCEHYTGILYPKMQVKCGLKVYKLWAYECLTQVLCGYAKYIIGLYVFPKMPFFHSCKS